MYICICLSVYVCVYIFISVCIFISGYNSIKVLTIRRSLHTFLIPESASPGFRMCSVWYTEGFVFEMLSLVFSLSLCDPLSLSLSISLSVLSSHRLSRVTSAARNPGFGMCSNGMCSVLRVIHNRLIFFNLFLYMCVCLCLSFSRSRALSLSVSLSLALARARAFSLSPCWCEQAGSRVLKEIQDFQLTPASRNNESRARFYNLAGTLDLLMADSRQIAGRNAFWCCWLPHVGHSSILLSRTVWEQVFFFTNDLHIEMFECLNVLFVELCVCDCMCIYCTRTTWGRVVFCCRKLVYMNINI